jgi:hypothetical protein
VGVVDLTPVVAQVNVDFLHRGDYAEIDPDRAAQLAAAQLVTIVPAIDTEGAE